MEINAHRGQITLKDVLLEALSGSRVKDRLEEMPQVENVSGDDGGKTIQAHLFELTLNVPIQQFADTICNDPRFEQYVVFDFEGKCILLNVVEDLYWYFLDNGVWSELGVESNPEEPLQQMVDNTFKKEKKVTDYNEYLKTDYSNQISKYIK